MGEREDNEVLKERVELLMQNQAFLRLARSFEIYQRIYKEAVDSQTKQEIQHRMADVFSVSPDSQDGQTIPSGLLFEENLRDSEECKFTTRGFAEKIALSNLFEGLIEGWNQKPQSWDDGGVANDIVAYKIEKSDKDTFISIHINAANIKTSELIPKLLEGLNLVAKEMEGEKFRNVKEVIMASWLLAPKFLDQINSIFGIPGVIFLPEGHYDPGIINQALKYNGKSLEDYLNTGEKPAVGLIDLSKEEFIKRFS